jgi:5-methylcytosine-specific restriction endonuclease McrA
VLANRRQGKGSEMAKKGDSLKRRFAILKRDNFTCQYCGRKAPDVPLEVDHIIPKSYGGSDKRSNLITCCYECNIGKGGDPLESGGTWDATLRLKQSIIERERQSHG